MEKKKTQIDKVKMKVEKTSLIHLTRTTLLLMLEAKSTKMFFYKWYLDGRIDFNIKKIKDKINYLTLNN